MAASCGWLLPEKLKDIECGPPTTVITKQLRGTMDAYKTSKTAFVLNHNKVTEDLRADRRLSDLQVCVYIYAYVHMIQRGLFCGRVVQEQGPHNISDSCEYVLVVPERSIILITTCCCWARLLLSVVV